MSFYPKDSGLAIIGLALLLGAVALLGGCATRSPRPVIEPSFSIRTAYPQMSVAGIWDNPHLAQAE